MIQTESLDSIGMLPLLQRVFGHSQLAGPAERLKVSWPASPRKRQEPLSARE